MIADGREKGDGKRRAGERPRKPPRAPKLKSAARAPEKPGETLVETALFDDPKHFRADCRLVQAALGRRLPVDPELLGTLVEKSKGILLAQANPRLRDLDRLSRLLVSIERVNVAAEAAGILAAPVDDSKEETATPQDVLDLLETDATFIAFARACARGDLPG